MKSIRTPSIIIFTTIYNCRKTLWLLFKSFLEQTNKDFTHYIYNDGSVDNLDDIVQHYIYENSKKKQKIKIIYHKCNQNLGVDEAHRICFNYLFNNAYDFFSWIDSGDIVEKDYIDKVTKQMCKRPDVDVFTIRYKLINDSLNVVKNTSSIKERYFLNKYKKDQFPFFISFRGFVIGRHFCKTSVYLKHNPKNIIIDGKSNSRFFYDLQIFTLYCMLHSSFFYCNNIYYYTFADDLSYSKTNGSVQIDHLYEQRDNYVDMMIATADQKEEFHDFQKYMLLSFLYRELVKNKNNAKAKSFKREINEIIGKHSWPNYFKVMNLGNFYYQLASFLPFLLTIKGLF